MTKPRAVKHNSPVPTTAFMLVGGPKNMPLMLEQSGPERQRLNAILRSGDHVTMALEEFSQTSEAFKVLGEWDGRGVEIRFLHPEPGFPTFRRLIDKTTAWIDGAKKAWADEAAAESVICN
jgi:hypothetical protein